MVNSLLTKRPQTEAGIDLSLLIKELPFLNNKQEVKIWFSWFKRLWQRHYDFFQQKSLGFNQRLNRHQWWYTHKNLRRAYYHIHYALPNLFTFTKFSNLPKTNNAIEGFFSQLDNKVSIHRGLSQDNKESLINWFIYFRKFKQKPSKINKKPTLNLN